MADNSTLQTTVATPASGTVIAADEATYSGDTAKVQLVRPTHVVGTEGSRTAYPLKALSKTANFTRPANTNAYTAGDVVANSTSAPVVINFADVVQYNGGGGYITGAWLYDSANQSTKGQFELWLFTASPGLDNDNEAFTPTDAETRTLVAIIPFTLSYVGDATSGAGGNCVFIGTLPEGPIPFVCDAADVDFYGELVVRNGYTPVSAEEFYFRLLIEQSPV